MKITRELAESMLGTLDREQVHASMPMELHKWYEEIRKSFRLLNRAAAIFTNARAHFEEVLAEGDLDELASEMGGEMMDGGALHLAGLVLAKHANLTGGDE
jgi:hypothetical protein